MNLVNIFSKPITYKRPTGVINANSLVINPNEECWKQQHLRVKEIQKLTKGAGALLGYIDDGLGQNSEIAGRVRQPLMSFLSEGEFIGSHSTFGATIVGGTNLGIFPEMEFVSYQVLDPSNGLGSSDQIVAGIYQAKKDGLKVINLSIGSDVFDQKLFDALKDFCSDGESIAVIAAGNDGRQTDYPAAYAAQIEGVLSIAATEINHEGVIKIAAFSSWGVTTLAAPGYALKSIDHNEQLDFVSGTSFASPIVSGTIAVMKTLRKLNQRQVMFLLNNNCIDLGADKEHQGAGTINILPIIETLLDDTKAIKEMPTVIEKEKQQCSLLAWIFWIVQQTGNAA